MSIKQLEDDLKNAIALLKVIDALYPTKITESVITFLSGLAEEPALLEPVHDKIVEDVLKRKKAKPQ